MRIVVCVKFTPDAADLEVRPDGSLALERAEWIIGGFDLQAVEAAVRLAEALGGPAGAQQVIALSAGPRAIDQPRLQKDLLSRGPDELALVISDALAQADTWVTASVLAAALRKLGAVDLVLCGEGSADLYFQQVGLQLGEQLGLPTLNAISRIDPPVEGQVRVERSLEDEVEVLEVPLPAVLSVTSDIAQPRLPTMKEILKAGKKPVTEWSLEDLGLEPAPRSRVEVLSTRAPRQAQRKQVMLAGQPAEAAAALVEHLHQEGIL